MPTLDETIQAIDDGLAVVRKADALVIRCAYRLPGRLRMIDADTLVRLKAELRDFDARQKRWK